MASSGEDLKQQGIDAMTASNVEWIAMMRGAAKSIAQSRGFVCADDLRDIAEALAKKGLHPTHANAWGALFKDPEFTCIGYVLSQYPSNHSRRIGVWRLKQR